MRVEIMIYIYGAVCLSMIVFNIVYSLILRRQEPRLKRRCKKMQKEIQPQLEAIRNGDPVEEKHIRCMQRRLRRVNNLIAFDRVLTPLCENPEDDTGIRYIQQLNPTILCLAIYYWHKDNMQAGYFSYFLSRYTTKRRMQIDSVQDVLLEYIRKDSLYCCVNALQALCTYGNVDYVLHALELQDKSAVFLHEKILTESLLAFAGDHALLIHRLWNILDSFSERTQLALLNYIRFQSGEWAENMFAIMIDEEKPKELRLAGIRYFGRYPYAPALPHLLAFTTDQDLTRWEYATVSASALGRYSGSQVMEALKAALHSTNWYIRQAAAISLEAQQIQYRDMIDVMAGNDRYAREMMTYRLESRNLQIAEVQA